MSIAYIYLFFNDLSEFINVSSIILANRIDKNIEENKKIFTRDIFNNN